MKGIPFWKYIKEHKKLIIFALVLATINQFFSLLDPQLFRLIVDNYASKIGSMPKEVFFKGVILLLLGMVGVAFISRIAKNIQDYYVSVISQKTGASMYSTSVSHTFSLPFALFEDRRSGELLEKLRKARADVQLLIENLIGMIFLSLIGLLFVIVYAFTVHWIVGITYLLLIPILGITTFSLSRKIKFMQKNIVRESAELAGSTTETIRNVELVKSLGLENQEISRLNKVNEDILQLELSKIKMIRKLSFIQGTIINATRVMLLFVILWLMFLNHVSLGEFFTLFVYSFFIFTPMSNLGTVASQYQEAKASYEQLEEIINIPPEPKPKRAVILHDLHSISFDKVTFTYGSSDIPSVHDLNLSIKEGEKIAFVGPSGAGKSTILKLLLNLYRPIKGNVSINGINLKETDKDSLHQLVGFVSQETQLFAGTVRENLLFVKPTATDKECTAALQAAQVDHIIKRGNKGLNTRIGEGGIKLSGGERQRLAIARALLRHPKLLIFDEATSSLDSITEKSITKTIQAITEKQKNVITIMVAHRLSTIAHVDRIYVLQKGNIVETGNHADLLKQNGLYAALWKQQSGNE
ncbi:ABC transporter ATP-binding protein [Candidatus Woesearchaeota archaeon]|nr:MAG: ABC transporter ATP-binding protein [Candidatus Woesearchaeota archaeon]